METQKSITLPIRRWYIFFPCFLLAPSSFFLAEALARRPIFEASTRLGVDLPALAPREIPPSLANAQRSGGTTGHVFVKVLQGSSTAEVTARAATAERASRDCRRAVATLLQAATRKAEDLFGKHLAGARIRASRAARERDVAAQAMAITRGPELEALRARVSNAATEHAWGEEAVRDLEVEDPERFARSHISDPGTGGVATEVRPRRAAGFLAGLWTLSALLAALVTWLVERHDTRFRAADELRLRLRLPVIGAIPRVAKTEKALTPARLPQEVTEGYLRAASKLRDLAREMELRSIVVTSALPGEGKSTAAANLGASLAGRGMRVILLDGNLHQPSLEGIFAVESRRGLADLIEVVSEGPLSPAEAAAGMEDAFLREAVSGTSIPKLGVVCAGKGGVSTAARIEREHVQPIILRFCRMADLVICDAPALEGSSDALALSASADATLIVVCAKKTEEHEVTWARHRLLEAQASVLGALLVGGAPGCIGEKESRRCSLSSVRTLDSQIEWRCEEAPGRKA